MTQEINRQELVRQLRGLFGFRGATSFELGETIMPVANIGDLDSPPFHSKRGGIASMGIGPIAAQFSYCGLRANQAIQPDFRAVVKYALVSAGAAMNILMGPVNNILLDAAVATPAMVAPLGCWDTPVVQAGTDVNRVQLVGYQQTSVTSFLAPGQALNFPVRTLVFDVIMGPFMISPGNTLIIHGQTLNTSLLAAFYWDEYTIG